MKKGFVTRIVSILLAVLMLAAVPVTASADAGYTMKNLKQNVWATSYKKNYSTTNKYTYYKIKADKAGELVFTISKGGKITLYGSKSDLVNETYRYSFRDMTADNPNKAVAVDKGTYYLRVEKGKCKYKYKSIVNKTNYTRGKAVTLKANTKVRVSQTPKMNYTRWYKVKLTSKKRIVYWTNYATGYDYTNGGQIEVYDARGRMIETEDYGSQTRFRTSEKLAKGTYYICVKRHEYTHYDNDYMFGNVITVKWKAV